jgi:tryptophan synthase beta chain
MIDHAFNLPYDQPDARGHFGPYGGTYVAETLIHALDELRDAYERYRLDSDFVAEFRHELKHFVGRPSPIYHAARLSREVGGAQIHLKREDLNHTGAHKINNTIGQALLARRMGKPRVIATAWNAWCTWAAKTSSASRPTSTACTCSAPPWYRWNRAARR